MGKLSCVVGGQYGSEAKGAVCGYLGRTDYERGDQHAAVRVAGPNAGHSVVDPSGHKWALRQVPVAAVTHREARLYIAAGSEIDLDVLLGEVNALDQAGYEVSERLMIDWQATMVMPHHRQAETNADLTAKIGSTGKGIGAARAERIMRKAGIVNDIRLDPQLEVGDTAMALIDELVNDTHVVIEGTQGYGLGLHAGHYPQTTSSDCRAIDMLAMAGISPWAPWVGYDEFDVWVVLRTFPIRVAGNSGPMKHELTWDQVGQPEEHTTVTQKVRRVGEWDADLAREAIMRNGGENCSVALMMVDYVFPELAGHFSREALEPHHYDWLANKEREIGAQIHLLGTGPDTQMEVF
jgi:adenylosuccinate synthase